jgi:tRNA-(ms[2]io[6]A)-hydroxylase
VLAAAAGEGETGDEELAGFYQALHSSEFGHYRVFLKLAVKIDGKAVEARWQQMLALEAQILARQAAGPRIHSGFPGQ